MSRLRTPADPALRPVSWATPLPPGAPARTLFGILSVLTFQDRTSDLSSAVSRRKFVVHE